MSTVTLTRQTFDGAVAGDGIVVVDFWATWCPPCRSFAPVFERVSQRHADVVFGKVDTEAEPELSAAARISLLPTLMVFRNGVKVVSQSGALPETVLEEVIQVVRGLDMDEVRTGLARTGGAAAR